MILVKTKCMHVHADLAAINGHVALALPCHRRWLEVVTHVAQVCRLIPQCLPQHKGVICTRLRQDCCIHDDQHQAYGAERVSPTILLSQLLTTFWATACWQSLPSAGHQKAQNFVVHASGYIAMLPQLKQVCRAEVLPFVLYCDTFEMEGSVGIAPLATYVMSCTRVFSTI